MVGVCINKETYISSEAASEAAETNSSTLYAYAIQTTEHLNLLLPI